MTAEEQKAITDGVIGAFRYELSQFSENKIDPLIQTVNDGRKKLDEHGERLAAHRQRIIDVEKDVDGARKEVRAVSKNLDATKETHRGDMTRVMAIIITALVAILAAVIGLSYMGA